MLEPKPQSMNPKREIVAYDLEWLPGVMQLRLVGVYDGRRGYRSYETVESFLKAELTKRNAGTWFYAHAGGMADVQFILEALMKDDRYRVEGSFSGSSAVIVKVIRGSLKWYFIDSYFTLRAPLREIGKKLGMEKGEVAWDAPLPELRKYNEQDCRILWHAMTEFQSLLLGLRSEMKFTLASCAMRLIQRRYLKRQIPTSGGLNARLRPAYVGGRVEVFNRSRHSGWYYDINSCYPYAMTKPLPGRYLGMRRGLGDGATAVIAEVTLKVPDMYVPPVPYMYGGSLYFPVGTRRQWLCGPEIELCKSLGCEIVKVHEAHHFQWFSDLATYAKELYARRQESKGTFYYELYKLLLNSGYGKFGERSDKQQLLFRPTADQLKEAKEISGPKGGRDRRGRYTRGFLAMISPGIFLVEQTKDVAHAHVPIAAYVTSYARTLLYHHMAPTPEHKPFYCDTDGFAMSIPDLPTSTELGGLKLEKQYSDALFHAPKLYHLHMASGEDIVKAKGFRRLDLTEFSRLIAGGTIEVQRMMRLKELYSRGISSPMETTFQKRLQNTVIPKRYFYKDGSSRAWTVKEIEKAHEKKSVQEFETLLDSDPELV